MTLSESWYWSYCPFEDTCKPKRRQSLRELIAKESWKLRNEIFWPSLINYGSFHCLASPKLWSIFPFCLILLKCKIITFLLLQFHRLVSLLFSFYNKREIWKTLKTRKSKMLTFRNVTKLLKIKKKAFISFFIHILIFVMPRNIENK